MSNLYVEFSRSVVQNMVRHQMPHIELFFLNIRYDHYKDSRSPVNCFHVNQVIIKFRVSERPQKAIYLAKLWLAIKWKVFDYPSKPELDKTLVSVSKGPRNRLKSLVSVSSRSRKIDYESSRSCLGLATSIILNSRSRLGLVKSITRNSRSRLGLAKLLHEILG